MRGTKRGALDRKIRNETSLFDANLFIDDENVNKVKVLAANILRHKLSHGLNPYSLILAARTPPSLNLFRFRDSMEFHIITYKVNLLTPILVGSRKRGRGRCNRVILIKACIDTSLRNPW